jgi:hypothetical protein
VILQTAIPSDEELEKGRGITKKDHRILAIPADYAVIQSCDACDGLAIPFGEMGLEIPHRNLACDYF